jgi:putative spermidine/putrescine transport system substrate-binding protein
MTIEMLSRREVLVGGSAAALWLAAPRVGEAQQKELVANTYGGGWEAGHRLAIAQPLEKRLGIKVTLVSMLAAELVARTKAASGGRPPVDVALVDDGPFLLAVKEGVFQRLPMEKIPNAARIYARYRPKESYGVPIGASQIGIAYNAKKLKTRPESWNDFWNPEYKGRVGLSTPASTLGTVTLLSFARLRGGDEGNVEPGFEAVKSLLPQVSSIQAVPAQLRTLLERGEIDIAPMWHHDTSIVKSKGTGVEFVLPKEGGIAGLAWLAITNGANAELALEYLNQGLDLQAQQTMAGPPSFIGPVVEGVTVAAEWRGIVPAAPADLEKLKTLDWPKINLQRAEWINRWNREIKV